jgi:hypothetical protein
MNILRDDVFAVVTGQQEPISYLEHKIGTYSAYQFIMNNLPEDARVYFMWDGRGYYCDSRCAVDSTQFQWSRLVYLEEDVESVGAKLAESGYTHLLFSPGDLNFILAHDPLDRNRAAARFFFEHFQPVCTNELFNDDGVSILELTCN